MLTVETLDQRITALLARRNAERNAGWDHLLISGGEEAAWAASDRPWTADGSQAEVYLVVDDAGQPERVFVGRCGPRARVYLGGTLFDAFQPDVVSIPAGDPRLLERLGETLDELGV